MMRGLLLVFGFLLPLTAAGQASLSAGVTVPMGGDAIKDAYASGFGLWGAFGLSRSWVATPRVIAGFDVIRTDEAFLREVSDQIGVEVEGGDLSTIFAGFDALFVGPYGMIRPYLAPGFGLAVISVDEFTVRDVPFENVQSEQALAVLLTAGAAVRIGSGPHLMLEARLVHAFTEGDRITWLPVNLGVVFDLE